MEVKTGQLRTAYDVLAELCTGRMAGALAQIPAERAVSGLESRRDTRHAAEEDVHPSMAI
jgi:hypothetical protein